MKVHTIFIEPANYTQDLIKNVHQKLDLTYSFLFSESVATDDTNIISSAQYLFDKNGLWRNFKFLWQCSKSNDMIIVNGYNHFSFIMLWFLTKINGCFLGVESDTPYRAKYGLKGFIKTVYLRLMFSNKRILGFPGGRGIHTELFLRYQMPMERIFFLPMLVDNTKFYQEERVKIEPDHLIRFLFVGRFISEKNLHLLIRAFKTILKQREQVAELVLVGDGVYNNELQELSKGIPEIVFVGKKFSDDLLIEYKKADILILPSCSETWGLVVNEALCAGLPVLCSSAVGCIDDLVIRPDAGWIFNTEDEIDLVEKLNHILDNKNQILEKGKRGLELMSSYWNYSLYIENLGKIFEYVKRH